MPCIEACEDKAVSQMWQATCQIRTLVQVLAKLKLKAGMRDDTRAESTRDSLTEAGEFF